MMSTRYNIYFNGFIFCEFLNFAIVLLQFVVTNQFLSRRFLLYGLEVLLLSVWITIPMYVTAAGLALLPSPLRGAASSSRQKPNVPNFSKDRSVSTDNGEKSKICRKENQNLNNTPSAACNYWRWGGSGGQENINAICILGLNIVNDKVRG